MLGTKFPGSNRARGGDRPVPDVQAGVRGGTDPCRDPLPAHVPLPPPVHDCPAQDPTGRSTNVKSQNRLHQHCHRRPARRNAVSVSFHLQSEYFFAHS